MTAFCYICKSGGLDSDPIYACNNCGGLVCQDHGRYFDHSKNCFCTRCFPKASSNSLVMASDVLSHMTSIYKNQEYLIQRGDSEAISGLVESIRKVNSDESLAAALSDGPYLQRIERSLMRIGEILSS